MRQGALTESGTASALQWLLVRGRRHAELIRHTMPRAITWAYRACMEINPRGKEGHPEESLAKTGRAGSTKLGTRSRGSGLNRREIGTIVSILKSNRFSK